jgi:hypothetical protein
VAQVGRDRARDRLAVAERAAAPDRREHLAVQRVGDDPDDDLRDAGAGVGALGGDRDREAGMAVDVVGGAVDGVDDPPHPGCAGPGGALLAQHPVVGAGGEDAVDDGALREPVHVGDQVGGRGLGLDGVAGPRQPFDEERRRSGGDLGGQIDELGGVGRGAHAPIMAGGPPVAGDRPSAVGLAGRGE